MVGGPARVGWRLREIVFVVGGFATVGAKPGPRDVVSPRWCCVFHTCDGAWFSTSAPPRLAHAPRTLQAHRCARHSQQRRSAPRWRPRACALPSVRAAHVLLGVGWLYVLLLMHQSGIARTSDVLEQSESIADILSGTHTAIFLVDMHGMVHTDEIGMHMVLYSLLRAPRRDSRQPCPALPAHQRLLPRDVTWRRCAYSRNLRHKRESGCRGNRVATARCGATDVRGSAS